jgi:hypothetical protein
VCVANDFPDHTGVPSGFQYEEDDNSLVILNTILNKIIFIKIATKNSLKKISFCTNVCLCNPHLHAHVRLYVSVCDRVMVGHKIMH